MNAPLSPTPLTDVHRTRFYELPTDASKHDCITLALSAISALEDTERSLAEQQRVVEALQRALSFWHPGVGGRDDDEFLTRAGDDAMLLFGYLGPSEKSALELGWIAVRDAAMKEKPAKCRWCGEDRRHLPGEGEHRPGLCCYERTKAMTDLSPTPLTDAKERESEKCEPKLHAHYGWKLARTLERSLAELQTKLEIAEADRDQWKRAAFRERTGDSVSEEDRRFGQPHYGHGDEP